MSDVERHRLHYLLKPTHCTIPSSNVINCVTDTMDTTLLQSYRSAGSGHNSITSMIPQNLILPLRKPKINTNKKLYGQIPSPVPCHIFPLPVHTIFFQNILSDAFKAKRNKDRMKTTQQLRRNTLVFVPCVCYTNNFLYFSATLYIYSIISLVQTDITVSTS